MTTLALIAAVARNGVIGRDNALPWRLPEDLRRFRELTLGHPVIMGRKTWESLDPRYRPLPGRRNIVVSRQPAYVAAGGEVAASLDAALARLHAGDNAFVIGGAELYAQALARADRIYLTEIDRVIDGDAHFPAFDRRDWDEVERVSAIGANGLAYAFVRLERRHAGHRLD